MKYYFSVLEQYAGFRGRARRKEYWMFLFFHMVILALAMFLDISLGSSIVTLNSPYLTEGPGIFTGVYSLVVLIPLLAVTVRRLHDTERSGWMFFLNLIPGLGNLWFLVLMLSGGQRRRNRYGANPKKMKFAYELS